MFLCPAINLQTFYYNSKRFRIAIAYLFIEYRDVFAIFDMDVTIHHQ